MVMTKFGTIGAACLAVALAATPTLAEGIRGGVHFANVRGGFHGGGFRRAPAIVTTGAILIPGYDNSVGYDNNDVACPSGTVVTAQDGQQYVCQ
jgi:hypothetical protein